MKVRTPDGVGEVVRVQVVRGRSSYLVRGASVNGWYEDTDVFKMADFSEPPPAGAASLMGDFSDIPQNPATERDETDTDLAELPWDDKQLNVGDPATSTIFQDETDAEDSLHYDEDRGTELGHSGIPAQASVKKRSGEECPDCRNKELYADSEPDETGAFDVSCPSCGWRGQHNEYSDGPSDLADPDDDIGEWFPGFGARGAKLHQKTACACGDPMCQGCDAYDQGLNDTNMGGEVGDGAGLMRGQRVHASTAQSTGRRLGHSKLSEDVDLDAELDTGIGTNDMDGTHDDSFGPMSPRTISDQSGFEADLEVSSLPSSSPTPGTGNSFEEKPEGRGITSSLVDPLAFLDKIAEEEKPGYSRRRNPLGEGTFDEKKYETRPGTPWFMKNRVEDEDNGRYRDTGGYDAAGSESSGDSGDGGSSGSSGGDGGGSSHSASVEAGVGRRYKRTRGTKKAQPLGDHPLEKAPQQPVKNKRVERGIKGEEAAKPTRGRRRTTPAQPKGTHFGSFDLHFAANYCKCAFGPIHSKSEHLEVLAELEKGPEFSGSAEVDYAPRGVTPMDGLSPEEIADKYPGLAGRGIPEDPESDDDNLNMAHLDQILTSRKTSGIKVDRNGPHCENCGEDAEGDPQTWIGQHSCPEPWQSDYQYDPATLGFPVHEDGRPVENERDPLHTFGLRYPEGDLEEIDVHHQDYNTARAMAEHKAHMGYQPGWTMEDMEPGGSGGYVQIYHGSKKTAGDPSNGGAPQSMPMGGPAQQQMQIEMQVEQLMKFWAVDNFGWWHWTGSQQDLAMLNQMQQSMMPVMQPTMEPQGPQQEPGTMNPSSPMGPLNSQSSKKSRPGSPGYAERTAAASWQGNLPKGRRS